MIKSSSILLKLIILSFSFFCISCTNPELSKDSYAIPHPDTNEEISIPKMSDDIKLAAGDSLTVNVWGQDALTKEVTLDSSGDIYYPFIGKVKASGRTIEQLQATVTEKLSQYYVDPKVTVMPKNLAGQRYYILGEVNQPGKFEIKAQTAVLEAVASAGGPNKDAGKTVILLRKQENKLLIISIPLQYSNLTENNIPSLTMQVRAEDILYLAPSKIANVEKFMIRLNNILNPILALERGILYWPELVKAIDGSSGQQIILPVQ